MARKNSILKRFRNLVILLGGIGKTAVADVYVDKFKSDYKYIAKVFFLVVYVKV